jgi:hypothetical protein
MNGWMDGWMDGGKGGESMVMMMGMKVGKVGRWACIIMLWGGGLCPGNAVSGVWENGVIGMGRGGSGMYE